MNQGGALERPIAGSSTFRRLHRRWRPVVTVWSVFSNISGVSLLGLNRGKNRAEGCLAFGSKPDFRDASQWTFCLIPSIKCASLVPLDVDARGDIFVFVIYSREIRIGRLHNVTVVDIETDAGRVPDYLYLMWRRISCKATQRGHGRRTSRTNTTEA